jgi:phosphoesterase RecJ-like protein
VLRATVRLVDAGASLPAIMDAVFNHRPLELLRLWGLAMAAAQVADGVLWVEVSQEMLRQAQATPAAAKGLANFMSTFDGPCVTVILRELETRQVEVSFRSRPSVDVSGVALAFGGGGHPQASGCLVSGRLRDVRDRVLAALQVAILEQTGSGACL